MAAVATEAVIALALFGCIPVVVKFVSANPFTIGIFRLAVASSVIGTIAWRRGELRRMPRGPLLRLIVIGLLFFGHWLTYFLSIKTSSASIAAIGLSTYGVDLMILGALTGHGRVRAAESIAVVLSVIGAIVVVPNFGGGNGALPGMALALLSALFYAALPILHQRTTMVPTSMRTFVQFGVALVCFALFLPQSRWTLSGRDWAGLWFLAIGATLIAHTLWVRVTTDLSPAVASIIYYGNVPFAVLLGVLILHEPVSWRTVAGGALIIAGSVIGLLPQLQRGREAMPDVEPG